ncbi:peptidase domain-containing ABC transporter [Myxococcus qinghaiensis]|uniref:peptidase domain-containing ABC transporter n=1 Tax=Myxococcus qinghaiensis TaxID=2906758 RepID=UPI0020A7DBA2|nr:peptidase domain-containing ABC transporter [Myxococcus qinghaiensis]MCP3164274.1 peptidase domain-containing ABC transporter [Myxococcus qinghaiensis]
MAEWLSESEARFPALKRLGERLRGRRIPFVAQFTAVDCGAACLAMVLGYWGRPTRMDDIQSVAGLSPHGISARALLEVGRRFGLRGRAVQVDIHQMHLVEAGAILHWEFRHFVVFERMTRTGVELLDPGLGRRYLSLEQFRKAFTGVALLFEPSETFETGKAARGPHRYFQTLRVARPLLMRVGALSLLLQLLALALPSLTGVVVDRLVPGGDMSLLAVLAVGMSGIVVFQLVSSLIRSHLLLHLRTNLDARLTVGFLDHLVHLPFPFFQLRSVGDLMGRINSNTTVREVLTSGALSALIDGGLVFLYLGLLLLGSWKLGLLALGMAFLNLVIFLLVRARRRELMTQSLEVGATAQNYEVEMLAGMQTIKAMGLELRAVQNWSSLYVDMLNVTLDRGRLEALFDSVTAALRMASPLILMMAGAYQVMTRQLSLGEMLALNALAAGFLGPVSGLLGTASQFQLVGSYLDRVDDVLEAPLEQPAGSQRNSIQLRGGIQVKNAFFRYGPMTPWVVQDVSLEIEPGQFVAIVGRSGAGKSSLAQLLLGLYVPNEGSIRYDGVALSELDLHELRRQVGVVLQNPMLFRGDIRRNIAYADPELPLDKVMEAASRAQVHDDIQRMPMGYSTLLSDMGASVSGGQRQRLALARALARDPAILLLDEATNALDVRTEKAVQSALSSLRCTRIVIAHRLSTIREADVILVMHEGRLVERGTHQELLALRGHYHGLVSTQDLSVENAA